MGEVYRLRHLLGILQSTDALLLVGYHSIIQLYVRGVARLPHSYLGVVPRLTASDKTRYGNFAGREGAARSGLKTGGRGRQAPHFC